ncbi:MAG: D-glycerate dehydrogenase [Myxococcales bacterium]|nr:D-glycerate dehydrogenase [Myxococcales bacterium]
MSPPRVFVTRKLPGDALERLRARTRMEVWEGELPPPREALLSRSREAEGLLTLLTDRVDAALLEAAPSLRALSNMAAGVDNIDLSACTARGIPVGHTPFVLTETTADFAFALLLAAARRIVEADAFARSGRWRTWQPALLLGRDVHGATLGIAGMGAIGRAVARRAAGFGMRLLYSSRSPHPEEEAALGAMAVDKRTLLRESDFLSLHLPLTAETRHYLGAAEMAQMKPTAVLINTSRGAVVDQPALVEALRRGRPAFAALDVTDPEPPSADEPLLRLPNLLLAPHLGSASYATRARMASLAVDNLLAALEGRPLPHCANPQAAR